MHPCTTLLFFFWSLVPTYRHIQENIANKIGLILSFSLILIWGARVPVVRIGRIAGQYAKPRSSTTEKLPDGREVLSFR
jgi:3-deoxy-7-phosphoheptulonate synthase